MPGMAGDADIRCADIRELGMRALELIFRRDDTRLAKRAEGGVLVAAPAVEDFLLRRRLCSVPCRGLRPTGQMGEVIGFVVIRGRVRKIIGGARRRMASLAGSPVSRTVRLQGPLPLIMGPGIAGGGDARDRNGRTGGIHGGIVGRGIGGADTGNHDGIDLRGA